MQIKVYSGFTIFSKSWHNLLVIFLFALVLGKLAINKNYKIRANKIDILMVIVLLYGFFQVAYSYAGCGSLFTPLQGFRTYYLGVLLYFVTRSYIKRPEDIRLFIKMIMIVTLLAGLGVILEFSLYNLKFLGASDMKWEALLSSSEASYYPQGEANFFGLKGGAFRAMERPLGIFYHMQYTAAFILIGGLMCLPFYVWRGFDGNNIKKLFLDQKYFLILTIAIFLATSRTIIFSFVLILLFIFLKYKVSVGKVLIASLSIFIILAGINYELFINVYAKDVFSGGDTHIRGTFGMLKALPAELQSDRISTFLFGDGFNTDLHVLKEMGTTSARNEGVISERRSVAEGLVGIFYQIGFLGSGLLILLTVAVYRRGMLMSRMKIPSSYKQMLIGLSIVPIGIVLAATHLNPITAPGIHYIYFVIIGIIGSFNVNWFANVQKNSNLL
ncbi:MAG: hypothetical protein GY777_07875 [Candidatus Brocadiaceae bacterium]|nr:hypothetical protein [Candidatus Brocadiaceae bacterium]